MLERDETDLVQCTTSTTDAQHAKAGQPQCVNEAMFHEGVKVRQQTLRERVCES